MQITIVPSENKCGSEHIPRMVPCGEISEGLWENSMKLRPESWDLIFFKNLKLFLDDALVPLPGIADWSEFTSDDLL